ncbi:MAG: hypothetical protein QM308_10365 [Bacillota bacterium]|nr:hypothetical protein [Bacillota bacterium]
MKRKIILLATTFFLLLSATAATAHGFDLQGMTLDQLTTLMNDVQAEIAKKRTFSSIEVDAGTYTIGVDIPAGIYMVECATDAYYSAVTTKNSEGKIVDVLSVREDNPKEIIGKLELNDGMILKISAKIILYPKAGGVTFHD